MRWQWSRTWPAVMAGVLIIVSGHSAPAGPPAATEPSSDALDRDRALVGWWKLDETSGVVATDSSPKGHRGSLDGGLTFATHSAPGRRGKALKLDGAESSLRIDGYKGVTGTAPRTVAAWVRTTTPAGEVVSWGSDEAGKMWTLGFIRGHLGVTPKGGYLYMRAGLHDGAWHHVAVVVREAAPPNLHDDVKLYADGELAEIDDIGLLDLYPIETGSTQDVRIGRRFKGLLDDIRIYGRALTDDEIKTLAGNQGTRGKNDP